MKGLTDELQTLYVARAQSCQYRHLTAKDTCKSQKKAHPFHGNQVFELGFIPHSPELILPGMAQKYIVFTCCSTATRKGDMRQISANTTFKTQYFQELNQSAKIAGLLAFRSNPIPPLPGITSNFSGQTVLLQCSCLIAFHPQEHQGFWFTGLYISELTSRSFYLQSGKSQTVIYCRCIKVT